MPIVASDIVFRLSGGGANVDPVLSLGGVKSNTAVVGSTIFDTVSGTESDDGSVEYRCIYVENTHATLTFQAAIFWITANTPSATTAMDVGGGSSAVNGTEQATASEVAVPAGITFVPAATLGAGVALGDIPPGQHRAVWLRRTVTAGTVAAEDTCTFQVAGETAA